MFSDPGPAPLVAAVVGLPGGIRARLERRFAGAVAIRTILLRQDGGFRLQPPPNVAAGLLEQFADEASSGEGSYGGLLIVVLPYAHVPNEVIKTVEAMVGLGAAVVRPSPGSAPWPSRSPRLDQEFQGQLLGALIEVIGQALPASDEANLDDEVAFELLRGLAAHSKMGPNNHSHEDDLWKSRGKDLGPGGKERVLGALLASGLVGRKKNDSAGGKGWVYWIGDVAKARERFPALTAYLR